MFLHAYMFGAGMKLMCFEKRAGCLKQRIPLPDIIYPVIGRNL